ncbi:MAG TPA: hypothetical protein VKU00_18580 [Chthonomonadaceae bacterium]|nr:hypothetical protein [Chthonomonadaceae bacterium]
MSAPEAEEATVKTPEDCLRYVEEVGFCTWRYRPQTFGIPSLEMATPWRGGEVTNQTWFWKDDLHIERKLYFGMLLAPDVPVFVSLAFLPALIAAQGDIDARTLHEKGLLASNALRVYEHIERVGPTATAALPWPPGSRMLYLATLQQKFLLTKFDLTGRTRGNYGYRWCLCEDAFPDSFEAAARIEVPRAREQVVAHLNRQGAKLTPPQVARLFRWQPL